MKQKYITTILVAIPLCLLIIVLVMKHGPRVQDAAAPAPPTGVCKLKDGSSLPPGATSKCEKQMSQSDCMYNPTTVPPVTKGQCTWVPAPKPSPSPPKPSPPKPAPSPPKPSPPKPSPPKPPAPPKPSPAPKPAPSPSQGSCELTTGKASVYKAVCEKQKTEKACAVVKDTCTWDYPPPPLPPKPSPASLKCNPNLIWTEPINAAGDLPAKLKPPYELFWNSCYSYGVNPLCPDQKDKKTCEAASDGGDLGKCRWDSKNSKCLYDLDHMRNQCNSSVQITSARFPKDPAPSGLTKTGVATQFENCKWVQQKCTPNGNACPKGQTCVKGYCTFGDDDSGGYSERDYVWPQMGWLPGGAKPTQAVWCVPQSVDLLGDGGMDGGEMAIRKNPTLGCTGATDFQVPPYPVNGRIPTSKCAIDKIQVGLKADAEIPPVGDPNAKFVDVDQIGGNKFGAMWCK